MTDRLTALEELKAKVEAGEEYATMGHTLRCQKAFPKPDNFDGSREAYAKSDAQMAILAWRNGSLDAALALHNAVLPGFMWTAGWEVASSRHRYVVWREHEDDKKWITGTAGNECPARAWLLAILSALIELEKADD